MGAGRGGGGGKVGGAWAGAAAGAPVGAGPRIGLGMASGSLRFRSPALCSAICFTCRCQMPLKSASTHILFIGIPDHYEKLEIEVGATTSILTITACC